MDNGLAGRDEIDVHFGSCGVLVFGDSHSLIRRETHTSSYRSQRHRFYLGQFVGEYLR